MTPAVRIAAIGPALFLTLLSLQCASEAESPVPPPANVQADLSPIFSVKELMENIIDPQADFIFDAVAVDISDKGVVETKPTSDDDWTRVQRGAVILAEGTNLLKMHRRVAPEGDENRGGPGQPELSPEQIQAKLDQDRTLWDSHADQLRAEALKVLEIVKAKDADRLFQAGSDIDRACEACHLEYWYPGDKAAVLRDRNSKAYTAPPAGK